LSRLTLLHTITAGLVRHRYY